MERMDTQEKLDRLEINYDYLKEENKKLKEERDLYKARNEELNENCFGLAKENKNLKDEIGKLRLHIEAKDEAYMKLLEDYEKLKEGSEIKEETLIKAIGDIFNKLAH